MELGLPISPLCDRSVTCIPESQLGMSYTPFLSYLILLSGLPSEAFFGKENRLTPFAIPSNGLAYFGLGGRGVLTSERQRRQPKRQFGESSPRKF